MNVNVPINPPIKKNMMARVLSILLSVLEAIIKPMHSSNPPNSAKSIGNSMNNGDRMSKPPSRSKVNPIHINQ